jgi:hypothetical protein
VGFWKRLRRLIGSDSDFRCADSDFDWETCREPQANPVPPTGVIVKRSATVLGEKEDDFNTASLDGLRPYRTAKRRWQVGRRV